MVERRTRDGGRFAGKSDGTRPNVGVFQSRRVLTVFPFGIHPSPVLPHCNCEAIRSLTNTVIVNVSSIYFTNNLTVIIK